MSTVKNPNDTANKSADALSEGADKPAAPEPSRTVCDMPALAVRCDGKILLSLVDLEDVDLSSREVWVGFVLTEAEASDIHERINFEEAAAPTTARIRALAKKIKKPDNDE